MFKLPVSLLGLVAFGGVANATAFTTTSPTGGALPSGVTSIGGLVVDLTGTNGNRVVSQLAASSLFVGNTTTSITIGTQSGFTPSVLSQLGGGLASASFRVTLYDGDNAPGNFDFHDNLFTVDGITIDDWSNIATQVTNSTGTTGNALGTGFGDNVLATGWFTTASGSLANLYSALGDGSLTFGLTKLDGDFQFYDFTQGVDGGLINVGTGPVVTPPTGAVPEPAAWALMICGFGMVGAAMRRSKIKQTVRFA